MQTRHMKRHNNESTSHAGHLTHTSEIEDASTGRGTTLVIAAASPQRMLSILHNMTREHPRSSLLVASSHATAWKYRDAGFETWSLGELWLDFGPGPRADELRRRGISRIVLPRGWPQQSLIPLARWLRRMPWPSLELRSPRSSRAIGRSSAAFRLRAATVALWFPRALVLRSCRMLDLGGLLAYLAVARVRDRLRPHQSTSDGPVCHVIHSLGTGGAQRQLVEYLRWTRKHAVPARLLVIIERENEFSHTLEEAQIQVETLCRSSDPSPLKRFMRSGFPLCSGIVALKRRLHELAPRATVSWFFQANLLAAPAARLAGVPRVLSSIRNLSSWKDGQGLRSLSWLVADRLAAQLNDTIIANSCRVAEDFAARVGFPGTRIEIVRNGIDSRQVEQARPSTIREDLRLPHGRRLLVTMGRLVAQKNHEMLLHCIGTLTAKGHDVSLLVIGRGDLEPRLQLLSQRLGLEERVHFIGHSTTPLEHLKAAEIFVLSSRFEGMPNAVMEAQACGLPVVATDCGGTAEVVRHGETGLIVPVDDETALTEAIEQLLNDPESATTMGRRGAARMQSEFSVAKTAEAIDRLSGRTCTGEGPR